MGAGERFGVGVAAVLRLRSRRRGRAFGPAGRAARHQAVLCGVLLRLAEGATAWGERAGCRRTLAGPNDLILRDLGIDRAAVGNDSTSWFWRFR